MCIEQLRYHGEAFQHARRAFDLVCAQVAKIIPMRRRRVMPSGERKGQVAA
jgi:hypothetical protein